MKKFPFNAVVAAALALPALAFAQTTTFTFDPTGTAGAAGDITGLGAIDQSPGNALAVGAVGAGVGSMTTLLYQANLGTLNDSFGNGVFLDGTGGNYFTFVAGFRETLTSLATSGGTSTATFGLAAQQPNFFYMYRTAAPGDNLTGLGFTSGTRILEGTLNQANFSSSFTSNSNAPVTFDQFGSNNYPGVTSVTGTGASSFNATITSFNPLYFPTFSASNLTLSFFNTSQVVPFEQVDPSALFSSNGTANGDMAANRGAVNGVSGPNFQFQADANTSFQVSAVPEPESYALMLGGLALVGFVARRRKAS
ncbi:MAG TPA: PEP-CTERM sorting domain-containing protein [Acidobacteriaceae bacterium]|nr:PEP-CTERM sorting domain-containing protein [Acidobacteriaceae bacterium]